MANQAASAWTASVEATVLAALPAPPLDAAVLNLWVKSRVAAVAMVVAVVAVVVANQAASAWTASVGATVLAALPVPVQMLRVLVAAEKGVVPL